MANAVKQKLFGFIFAGLLLAAGFNMPAPARAADNPNLCNDHSTVIDSNTRRNGSEDSFCADNGGYGPNPATKDPNRCNDGTVIDSNTRRNGSEDSFCASHGGYLGGSTATTCGGTNQPICLGSKPQGNDTCGTGDHAVTISFNIGCNQSFDNPMLDGAFAIFRALSVAAGVIVVASIVVAGIQYTTSMGQPDKTLAAIKRIRSALIALLLYLFMFALIQWLVPGGLF